MITTTYSYSSGSGFNYDASKISFVGGMAQLLLNNNPAQTFSQNYAVGTGFTYNSLYTEFTTGNMNQVGYLTSNLNGYFAWDTVTAGNYGNGNLAVTLNGAAAIVAGKMKFSAVGDSASLNTAIAPINVGTIAFTVTPAYTGSPTGIQTFLYMSGANTISLTHSTNGQLFLTVSDSANTNIVFTNMGAWSPTSGTSYNFCLQVDITSGATKLFINNVQSGTTQTGTGVQTSTRAFFQIGNSSSLDSYSIGKLAFFNTIVTPTVASSLPDTAYVADIVSLPVFTYSGLGSLQSWTSVAITDSNGPGYTLNGLYYNGTSWVASNNTYTQSNSASQVQSHITSLPAANTLQVNVITQSSNTTQMSCSLFSVTYVGQIYPKSGPTIATATSLSMDQLSSFAATLSVPGSTAVLFYFNIGGSNYWWNGTAWTASDGTYSQANTAAQITANVSTFPVTLGAFVTLYALLYTPDGAATPTLTSATIVYDYFGPEPTGPNYCTVYGYILDEKGMPVSGATVKVTNPTTFINQGIVFAQGYKSAITNSQGYFSFSLVETATLLGANPLQFDVTYTQAQVGTGFSPVTFSFGSADIPNNPSANIATLTFV